MRERCAWGLVFGLMACAQTTAPAGESATPEQPPTVEVGPTREPEPEPEVEPLPEPEEELEREPEPEPVEEPPPPLEDAPLDLTGDFVSRSPSGAVRGGRVTARPGGSPRASHPHRKRPSMLSPWSCSFPAAARAQGIERAVVTVSVDVTARGTVHEARIVRDPGYGFGVAARACVLKARFAPAEDDLGRPVDAKIVIRVVFRNDQSP